MKKLLFLTIIPFLSFGQSYSTYYGTHNIKSDVNINSNVNVKKNVNVSGSVNKTIKTIDYGALANANAQQEKNRIEALKLQNEKDYQAMIEIAINPSKAFYYGDNSTINVLKDYAKKRGFKTISLNITFPHKSLFDLNTGLRNISQNGVITELDYAIPHNIGSSSYVLNNNSLEYRMRKGIYDLGPEQYSKNAFIVGEINKDFEDRFIHKIDLNKTEIYGIKGFLLTIVWEDEYEYVINDYYMAKSDDLVYYNPVTFSGDKDEISFEDLEGRRHYLKRFIDQFFSSLSTTYKKRN